MTPSWKVFAMSGNCIDGGPSEDNTQNHDGNGGDVLKDNERNDNGSGDKIMSTISSNKTDGVKEDGIKEDGIQEDAMSSYFAGPARNQSSTTFETLVRCRKHNRRVSFFPLFMLPRELLEAVMDYILVPGEIHPTRAPMFRTNTRTKGGPRSKKPGVQFLATCRQAYIEGHKRFYQQNTFCIPPGMIEYSANYFYYVTPYHKGLIKSISMSISCHDLDKDAQDFVGIEVYDSQLERGGTLDTLSVGQKFEKFLQYGQFKIDRIWDEKMDWISRWENLSHLTIDFRVGSCRWNCAREIRIFVGLRSPLGRNHPHKLTIIADSTTREEEYRVILGGWQTVRSDEETWESMEW
ncbi:MAG: hypothetical protein M1830_002952 [Pleopsidium flavum]|nr:MAG: hypothetical protein M1830_002952 [Pleopsidium flavum]